MDRTVIVTGVVIVVCLIILAVVRLLRHRRYVIGLLGPKRIWHYVRFEGGGTRTTSALLYEDDALEQCAKLGRIAYVDRDRGFIFYRSN